MIEKPDYASFEPQAKFNAILSIIGRRLLEHPNAYCSYSGGSDSDIVLDLVERARKMFELPPIPYYFVNTGLEMEATKRHVKEVAEKYGVEIIEKRPKKSIVTACRENGIPIFSKTLSQSLDVIVRNHIPIEVREYFEEHGRTVEAFEHLLAKYPKRSSELATLCSTDTRGNYRGRSQNNIDSQPYLYEYMKIHPIDFNVSAKCCNICKKSVAHEIDKVTDMSITGERFYEGGLRANGDHANCFEETSSGRFKLKPIYWVTDAEKAWYKKTYGLRYSDAYEVYGLTRTGCCGCSISSKAVENLEKIRPHEPQLVKAAWAVFGDSYRYRQQYDEYRKKRKAEDKTTKHQNKTTIKTSTSEGTENHE